MCKYNGKIAPAVILPHAANRNFLLHEPGRLRAKIYEGFQVGLQVCCDGCGSVRVIGMRARDISIED